jgi:5-methylcytosine-specific restriction endonuclease McrA
MPNTFDQAYDSLCSPQCEDALGERVERLINYVAPVRRKQISSSKRLALFERDGWTCYLCDFPVNRDASWPDADFPVLDHVVPYAKGGSDTPDNLKTAHALCNGQKKDADLAAYLSRALGVPNFAR